jgi:hypothetical protein
MKAKRDSPMDAHVTLDDQQMNTAQKLLLFWRKPAVRTIGLAETIFSLIESMNL